MKTPTSYTWRIVVLTITALIILCTPVLAYDWTTNSGDGSEGNPYQISTPEQLISIGPNVELLDKCFILVNDIDLSGYTFTDAIIAPDKPSPGTSTPTYFRGRFDGDYYIISNLKIINPDQSILGLFGKTFKYSRSSVIKNIGLENVYIEGRNSIGGLIGVHESLYGNSIENCYVTGTVKGRDDVGGLVGAQCYGIIKNCYADVTATGRRNVGGVLGINYSSTPSKACEVRNCYALGTVVGQRSVGGVVGRNSGGKAVNCYAAVRIIPQGSTSIGGVVGYSHSSNNGSVKTGTFNCFWNRDVANVIAIGPGRGLKTAELITPALFMANNWGTGDWTIKEGEYPQLAWEGREGELISNPVVEWVGSGTQEYPWQLNTDEDLIALASGAFYWDKHYLLNEDIDLNNRKIKAIGYDDDNFFSGSLDGGGHVLSNLYINDDQRVIYRGFFGHIASGGMVKNLGIKNIYVEKSKWSAGGLVGMLNEGWVNSCFVKGEVYSEYSAGGIVARCSKSNIMDCYVEGVVSGVRYVGGIAGNQDNSNFRCYSTAKVSADSYWGPIIGNSGIISDCYHIDTVCKDRCRGNHLTEEQMKQSSSFVGWDFIGETANGIEDVWGIHNGSDHPRLWWEFINSRPIASVGPTQTVYAWIDGYAQVQLDGSGSYDEDGDELSFYWYNDVDELIANFAEPKVTLEVGEHIIDLIVSDGIESSEPNSCIITVVELFDAVARVFPSIINTKARRSRLMGRVEIPGEDKPVLDANQPMLMLAEEIQIQAKQERLVYSEEESVWYLVGVFDMTSVVAELPETGYYELNLVSRFESGQWLCGRSMVSVK